MEETLKNLLANNFEAKFAENRDAVKQIVFSSISKDVIVGVGDSATVRQLEIVEEFEKKGFRVLNPFSKELTTDREKTMVRDNISRQIFSCDVLVCGTNSVTRDGKLVNIDAVGNRVASMIFGPRRVFIIAGKNKIVKDVDEALCRIKNVIAPFHARTKGFATPCAQTGKCSDCSAPKRICSIVSIIEKRPWRTEISVILANEDLGLSWDETWPEDRIRRIKSNYEKVTWVFASAETT
ncbi:MAG: lactate utilization protein [Candidatus Bathyarchaeota archaeon]|nr:lactate utilization protein [Candidatus Bathyarchaeota archaeon]